MPLPTSRLTLCKTLLPCIDSAGAGAVRNIDAGQAQYCNKTTLVWKSWRNIMNTLFTIELSPLLSFVIAILLLLSAAGFYSFFRMGMCKD
jgi:hypothetical protein